MKQEEGDYKWSVGRREEWKQGKGRNEDCMQENANVNAHWSSGKRLIEFDTKVNYDIKPTQGQH